MGDALPALDLGRSALMLAAGEALRGLWGFFGLFVGFQ